MKIVHVFTEQGLLLKDKQVEDNYQLSSNESLNLPENVTYSISYQPISKTMDATPEQQLLMQQSQQITLLQSTVMQQNQANAKLQVANQQQEKQIEQLQQLFMQANQQQALAKAKEEVQR